MATLLALLAVAGSPTLPAPAPPAPSGFVEAGANRSELLSGPARAEVRTPEGFLRVEGPAGAAGGSFTVRTFAPPAATSPAARARTAPEAALGPAGSATAQADDPCRSYRSRYLRRLLQMSGIDLDDPLAFVDGLGAGRVDAATVFSSYGLLADVDPIRPLAWDLELRSLARDLTACAAAAAADRPSR
jgi:hypothetical protein